MKEWQIFTFLALLMFGLWSFFPKLVNKYVDPLSGLLWSIVGTLVVGVPILVAMHSRLQVNIHGSIFGILTGVVAVLGTLFFFFAVRDAKVSIVVAITALYPAVVILLARIFLNEAVTLTNLIGIVVAIIAVVLLSI